MEGTPLAPWASLALAPFAVLLACAGLMAARRWRAPHLPEVAASGGLAEAITVLVPVRDEERNLGPCLSSLLASNSTLEILVIDDDSSDATPVVAGAALASAGSGRLLPARPLPPGWRGKVNALATGFAEVTTPWTLLVDADSRVGSEAPARALAHARRHGLAAVSLAARQEAGSVGEDLLVPAVFGLLDFLLGSWRRAAAGGPPVSAGQFVLFSSEALRGAGGFEAIRDATLDDVALFRLLRARGHGTGFVRAPDLLTVRMYDGLRSAIAGWRRNLAVFLAGSDASVLRIVAVLTLPLAALATLALVAPPPILAASYGLGSTASVLNRLSGRQRLLPGLLWPAECSLLAATLVLAWRDRRRGRLPVWKGRSIRL